METQTFRARVSIVDASGEVLFQAPAPMAESLLKQGASVWATRGQRISAVRLAQGQHLREDCAPLERPGSYGIKRLQLETGQRYYQHKKDWGEELEALKGAAR